MQITKDATIWKETIVIVNILMSLILLVGSIKTKHRLVGILNFSCVNIKAKRTHPHTIRQNDMIINLIVNLLVLKVALNGNKTTKSLENDIKPK